MSQDQGDEGQTRGPAAQAGAAGAHAEPLEVNLEGGRPVKVGRPILLLSLGAIALAYTGISGRRHDDEKLKQWTDAQAVPVVALVSLQKASKARELVLPGNVEAFDTASIHGQVSGYVREWRIAGHELQAVQSA